MSLKNGDKLYQYTIRNKKFVVHEGTVTDKMSCNYTYRRIVFNDGKVSEVCPKEEKIGKLIPAGPSIWLKERNDDLAKDMFIRYEKECLSKLLSQVADRKALICMLKEGENK